MIEIDNVSKSYDGDREVVKSICLHVRQGELMVLLGASGCGKTTTLKMINRLVERTSGTIRIDGQDTNQMDVVTLRRGIGYVFQMIGLFPHMTVAQNVATVPKLLGWPNARVDDRVRELLEVVNLPADEFAGRRPRELSGGQRQRVGFARALAAGPKVMLLDEPFGALDPITRDSLQTEFKRLQVKLGLTAVMVTHDIMEALLMADRIAVMHEGQIVGLGTPAELMANPGHEYVAALLEMPKRQADQLEAIARPQTEVHA
ncbi:MAG TPA: ATP-binding cassette domain-containing protein [Tepidisphaeraceae bacterium]|nr:ATP-binding cassette domain-containing protein [Tepidisphaeraceae bacterium]